MENKEQNALFKSKFYLLVFFLFFYSGSVFVNGQISGKKWHLQQYKVGFNFISPNGSIELNSGNISWSDGNNSFHSRADIENNKIRFSGAIGTMRGNPPNFIPKNKGLSEALHSVNNFSIDSNGRLLLRKDDEVLLIFR